MFIDSHCHIHFPEFKKDIPLVLKRMSEHQVTHALSVSVTLEAMSELLELVENYPNLYASVGVHPDHHEGQEPIVEDLIYYAAHDKVIAIGETGLDYFHTTDINLIEKQQERFRTHIEAAKLCQKPLIIHTRNAAEDTLRFLREEKTDSLRGVMHCFTESWEVAQQAMALDFYISFSGIVTFKNALALKEVARQLPLDRLLIETDAPYLAPPPHRGKRNEPAYVSYVAQEIAQLRNISIEEVAKASTENFKKLFFGEIS